MYRYAGEQRRPLGRSVLGMELPSGRSRLGHTGLSVLAQITGPLNPVASLWQGEYLILQWKVKLTCPSCTPGAHPGFTWGLPEPYERQIPEIRALLTPLQTIIANIINTWLFA